jgi:hypothetical protein
MLKQGKNQTVRFAHLVMMQTRVKSGNWPKWMPTMLLHGARAAQPLSKTVRCCAKHTTEQKEIGNLGNRKRIWKFDRALDKFKKV